MPREIIDSRNEEINRQFIDLILNKDDVLLKEASAATQEYIQTRVEETSVMDEVLPPQTIGASELDRTANHDEPTKIIDLDVDATAVVMDFRGMSDVRYLTGQRIEVPFHKIMSERIRKSEAELGTYKFDIIKLIEKKIINAMAKVKDQEFFTIVKHILENSPISSSLISTEAIGATSFTREHIGLGEMLMVDNEVNLGTIVMSKKKLIQFTNQTADWIGHELAGEITKNGFQTGTIKGYSYVASMKSELFEAPTETIGGTPVEQEYIYFFAAPKMLGVNYILNDINFHIKRELDIIELVSYGYYGSAIGNIRGVTAIKMPKNI